MRGFKSLLVGALLGFIGLASAAAVSYYGYNPVTGLEAFHGTLASGGVAPVATVSGSSCTISAQTGGASAGTFTETGGTSCTFTLTFPTATDRSGYVCAVTDLTTPADGPAKAASTTASTWVSGATTVVSADVLQYNCMGY